MSQCPECGGPVSWNEDAASTICTSCGTMADPSQCVLTTTADEFDSQYFNFNPSAPNTLKRLRGGSSWNLAGQGKEARARNHAYSMHALIKSLALALSAPGLSPRVCTLFDQAMRTMQFRWGIKAKMVAGACLSIALRESGRPDSLKDIAFLVERSDVSLKRTLSSVLNSLDLKLTSSGPTQYLSTLQSHLTSILQSPAESCGLHITLYSELKSLSIQSAVKTARCLTDLLARFSPELTLSQLSPAAVACAIFILSLEAEKRRSLSHLADISTCFANRCQVANVTVMHRYKVLQDEIAKWIEELEWLDTYQKPGRKAKVSKRSLCARGLKDALDWKDEVWKKRLEAADKPVLEDHSQNDTSDSESDCYTPQSDTLQPLRKRRKVNSAIIHATQFLLRPLHSSTPAKGYNASTSLTSLEPAEVTGSQLTESRHLYGASAMTCYLLSAPTSAAGARTLPTRLQRLSVARGGVGVDVISDDELLADGEWDSILRTPQEMQGLEQRWRDEGILDAMEKASSAARQKKELRNRDRKHLEEVELGSGPVPRAPGDASGTTQSRPPRSKRVNLEALSQFMLGEDGDSAKFDIDPVEMLGLEVLEDDKYDDTDDDEDEKEEAEQWACLAYDARGVECGEEVILEDWRPPSPGWGGSYDDYQQ